jgi:hypothetical protein
VAAHATIHAAAAQACSRRPPRVAGSPTRGWRRACRLLLPPHQSAHRLLRVRAPLAWPSPPMEVKRRRRGRAVFCESGRLQRGLLFRWRSSAAVEGAPSSVSLGASSTCRRRESAVSMWCTRLELSQGPRLHPLQAGTKLPLLPAGISRSVICVACLRRRRSTRRSCCVEVPQLEGQECPGSPREGAARSHHSFLCVLTTFTPPSRVCYVLQIGKYEGAGWGTRITSAASLTPFRSRPIFVVFGQI